MTFNFEKSPSEKEREALERFTKDALNTEKEGKIPLFYLACWLIYIQVKRDAKDFAQAHLEEHPTSDTAKRYSAGDMLNELAYESMTDYVGSFIEVAVRYDATNVNKPIIDQEVR